MSQAIPVSENQALSIHHLKVDQYTVGVLYQIPLDDLAPDPEQPRQVMSDSSLEELAVSIRELGVLQPILFQVAEGQRLIIVAGERRWRAAQMNGEKTIPAICVEKDYALIALSENIVRESLTPLEEAEACQRVIDADRISNKALADALGKSEATISEILRLNKLPEEIKEAARTNAKPLSRRCLLKLSKINDKEKQEVEFKRMMNAHENTRLASRGTEAQIRGTRSLITKLTDKLPDLKKLAWQADEDKATMRGQLQTLQAEIHEILNQLEK